MTSGERPVPQVREPARGVPSSLPVPAAAPRHRPPSFPTARSDRVRDCVFAAGAVAWAISMWAVHGYGRPQELAPGEGFGVFSETFERDLRMGVRVAGPGVLLVGEAVRRTREPYEGRLVIEERARAEGGFLGQGASLEFEVVSRWEKPPPGSEREETGGGFRMAETRTRAFIAGLLDEDIRATATRSGDVLVVRFASGAAGSPSVRTIRLPPGADLSSGLMDPARTKALHVGARWRTRSVGLSGELVSAEVEVVERGRVEIAGVACEGFRAVTRPGGRSLAQSGLSTWYDLEGRALRQELAFGPMLVTLDRLERLPATESGGRVRP